MAEFCRVLWQVTLYGLAPFLRGKWGKLVFLVRLKPPALMRERIQLPNGCIPLTAGDKQLKGQRMTKSSFIFSILSSGILFC